MRTITNAADTIVCFDQQVWLQERNLIFFHHEQDAGNPQWVKLYDGTTLLATYTLDANKEAVIDVSDYLRAYPSTTSLSVECEKDEETTTISLQVVGLINPDRLIIPPHFCALDYYKIVPPRMMLQDIGCGNVVEFRGHHNADEVELSPSDNVKLVTEGSVALTAGTDYFALYEGTGGERDERYTLRPLLCGNKYAAVEWVGATGATKRHTWKMKGATIETADAVTFDTVDNSYRKTKGRVESFTLYLDGLNAYDCFYYGDIVTSSRVRVSLDGTTWDQVEVATKSQSSPDGNAELQKIEISVNWRKYDAFGM